MQSDCLKLNCIALVWVYLCNDTDAQSSRNVKDLSVQRKLWSPQRKSRLLLLLLLLHVSVVFRCVDLLELHRTASTMHLQIYYASTMQKAHATISALCKYIICTVLAPYLHGTAGLSVRVITGIHTLSRAVG